MTNAYSQDLAYGNILCASSRPIFAMLQRKVLLSLVLLAGCASNPRTVNVQILPNEYVVEGVRSGLVTPAVDEVVRQKPKLVQISMCQSPPPPKVFQFYDELLARLAPNLTAGYYESCDGASVVGTVPAPQLLRFRANGMLEPIPPAR